MTAKRLGALFAIPACWLGLSCSESESPGLDDGGDDGRADEASSADADGEGDAEADADTGADLGCRGTCPNDPIDGPVGRPCAEGSGCDGGTSCIEETRDDFEGETYVTFRDGYCAPGGTCDPREPDPCGSGAACVDRACRDACARASASDAPWDDNCDCRDGYECSLADGACLPGCSNDRECCEIWNDDGDGLRQPGEVTLLPETECSDTCNPCTFSCVRDGCPGGGCRVGDPCEHASDCPPSGTCREGPDGTRTCTVEACDLDGRACPAGSDCGNVGPAWAPAWLCLIPCTPGTEPGSARYPCRDGGAAGVPDEGDEICMPAPPGFWHDATIENGYCSSPGNFAGGAGVLGDACTDDGDCVSPFGLGACVDLADTPPRFCTARCNAAVARDGLCGDRDGTTGVATGVCYSGLCLPSCDFPGGTLGSNGCTRPELACYDVALFGADVSFADSATVPRGLCLTACVDDAWCVNLWGRGTCGTTTGVCAL